MKNLKREIRNALISKRDAFSNKQGADNKITDALSEVCFKYKRIFVYISFGSEVDTIDFIKRMLEAGKEVYVPVCNTESLTMTASRITALKNLTKNRYGILEPDEIVACDAELDVVIFPGAAFDKAGNRIGYGKGYYDKFISALNYTPLKLGVCYDFQLLDEIPSEGHDVKMDIIITETLRREI